MADIIKSSLENGNILMNLFREVSNRVNSDYRDAFYSPITITLGDEFQSIVRSIKNGIEIIIDYEETLLKYNEPCKLRYVLNYGEIDTPINPNQAYQMLGEGLTESRKLLGNLKKNDDRFLIKSENRDLSKKLSLAFYIFQSFVDAWKIKDFEIVRGFLKYKDYKLVGKNLNKDISTMWRKEKSLKINEYLAIKEIIFLLTN